MNVINTSYTELADWNRRISMFVATNYWGEQIKPSTSITEDLLIDGEDAYELLEAFAAKYNVDFSTFNGKEYIISEGGINPFTLFYLALLLLIISFKYLLLVITYLLNSKQFIKINKFDCIIYFNSFFQRNLKDLTVGDLITSAILGKFTERKDVKFVII